MTRRRSRPASPPPADARRPAAAADGPADRGRSGVGAALGQYRELPPWVQAWTAVIGVLIAGFGLALTAIQVLREDAPAPTPVVIRPEAFIEEVTISAGTVEARGGFRAVDVSAEVILLIGRPKGATDERWLPVEAEVTPQASGGARVDGSWNALRPFTEGVPFAWRALVVPAGSGAADAYEDVRRNGPDSGLVLAASEEFVTGE